MMRKATRRGCNGSCRVLWVALVVVVLLVSSSSRTAVASSVAADWFDWLDVNHDGLIDRSEYRDGVTKLEHVVQNPLPLSPTAASSSWFSISTWSWLTWKGFWKAFSKALGMIVATEIGDKTFFIASVLSMRHDRSAVFCGALLALVVMTILSAALGRLLPNLLSPKYTHWIAGLLFLYFGIKLILESRTMSAHQVSSELEHVEEELLGSSQKQKKSEDKSPSNSTILDDMESGPLPATIRTNNNNMTTSKTVSSAAAHGQGSLWNALTLLLTPFYHPVVWQAFVLTFLAEWGDRSQIATIALSAAYNPTGVVVGGILGHAFCTGLAVMGGRMLAARISEKMVAQYGGILFLLFGIHSIFFETVAVTAATTAAVAASPSASAATSIVGAAVANAAAGDAAAIGEDIGN